MSTENQLAVLPQAALSRNVDHATWNALSEIYGDPSPEKLGLVLDYCRARKMDPLKKPVHIVPVWSKKKNCMVETIWPAISEVRATAMRTNLYAGREATLFGPTIKMRVGAVEMSFPEWAQVTVYRIVGGHRCAFVGPVCEWLECYSRMGKDPAPNSMWQKRAKGQLDKCFDSETEVLTTNGFEKFSEAKGKVIQLDASGLTATDAIPFERDWNGPMIVADGESLNFCVTPNHDMVLSDFSKIEAGDLFSRANSMPNFRVPHGIVQTKKDAPIEDESIILAAAFIADGYRHGENEFSIGVSRNYKVSALQEIHAHKTLHVRKCAGDVAVAKSGRLITTKTDKQVFTYSNESVRALVSPEKEISISSLLSLSRRQARLLLDTWLEFDGAENGKKTRRVFACRLDHVQAFEIAAVIAGYGVSQRRSRTSDASDRPNYMLTITDRETAPVLRYCSSQVAKSATRKKGKSPGLVARPNVGGKVWCVTVPSGMIVVRRNGFSMVCGNCAEAAALRAAFPEETGGVATAEEMEGKEIGDIDEQPTVGDAPVVDRPIVKRAARGAAKAMEAAAETTATEPTATVAPTTTVAETKPETTAPTPRQAEIAKAAASAVDAEPATGPLTGLKDKQEVTVVCEVTEFVAKDFGNATKPKPAVRAVLRGEYSGVAFDDITAKLEGGKVTHSAAWYLGKRKFTLFGKARVDGSVATMVKSIEVVAEAAKEVEQF